MLRARRASTPSTSSTTARWPSPAPSSPPCATSSPTWPSPARRTTSPAPGDGGNLVVIASRRADRHRGRCARLAERDTGWEVVGGDESTALVGDADVLTDEHAPVDQLLTPYRAHPP